MHESEDHSLRDKGSAIERENDIRIRTRQQISQFCGVLGMEYAKINFIPLIWFDRTSFWLCLSRRWWLRYSGWMRRLGSSYATVPLLMKLRLSRRCLERSMRLSVGRHISSGRSNIRLAKLRRGDVSLQRRRLSSRRVLLLLRMMKRRRMGGRRVDTNEFHLVWQSPDCVFKVSNGCLIKILALLW